MPGANTYGSLSSSSRRRVAGSVHREAGTVKPGGRSGDSASPWARTVAAIRSPPYLVVVIEQAELRAAAFRLLRLARLLIRRNAKDRPVLGRRVLGAVEAVHSLHGTASCVPKCP